MTELAVGALARSRRRLDAVSSVLDLRQAGVIARDLPGQSFPLARQDPVAQRHAVVCISAEFPSSHGDEMIIF